jgi:hypothetical protein
MITITKKNLAKMLGSFYCLQNPESFYVGYPHNYHVKKESIVKKEYIIKQILSCDTCISLIKKEFFKVLGNRYAVMDNNFIYKLAKFVAKKDKNAKLIKEKILKISKPAIKQAAIKAAQRRVREARKILRLAGKI